MSAVREGPLIRAAARDAVQLRQLQHLGQVSVDGARAQHRQVDLGDQGGGQRPVEGAGDQQRAGFGDGAVCPGEPRQDGRVALGDDLYAAGAQTVQQAGRQLRAVPGLHLADTLLLKQVQNLLCERGDLADGNEAPESAQLGRKLLDQRLAVDARLLDCSGEGDGSLHFSRGAHTLRVGLRGWLGLTLCPTLVEGVRCWAGEILGGAPTGKPRQAQPGLARRQEAAEQTCRALGGSKAPG